MDARGQKPQTVLTFPILVGTDGVQRMSKSTGNYIGLDEAPGVIFTKVLNVPDTAMRNYAELVTRWDQETIDGMFADIDNGTLSMRDFKQKLAWEIVSIFHSDEEADRAAQDAERMHTGMAPSDSPTFTLSEEMGLLDVMQQAGMVKSKGEARRLIQQGGVRINGQVEADVQRSLQPNDGPEQVVQAGKRKFLRVLSQ